MDTRPYHEDDYRDRNCFSFLWGRMSAAVAKAISQFHVLFSRAFFNLGKRVAQFRGYFIIIPLFLTALATTGFQRISYEDDPEYLFAPSTGPARGERSVIEDNFSMNFSSLFDPTRVTRTGRFARFIVTAKDDGTIFRKSIWDDILKLDLTVKTIAVEHEKSNYTFEGICAIRDGQCFKNEVLDVASVIEDISQGVLQLQYPINLEPFLLPHFFGGIVTDEKGEVILSAKATILYYWIRTNNEKENERGSLWEKEVLSTFADRKFQFIEVARFSSRTLEDELENNTNSVKPFVPLTLAIMTLFSLVVCLMGDWVRAKPLIGMMGVLISVMSSFAAFGFLIYCGVPFIGINMAAPFLMLGIGIDDTFVLLAAWRRTRLQDSVPQRLAETYSDAAVSITITSLTDLISFCVGILTPFPSVQIFCTYTGAAVLVTYIWHITLFGGCLAIAGYAERGQRHALVCLKVKSASEAGMYNCFYRAFCSGGISEKDPWNPKDNKSHLIMVFFRDYMGTFLNIPAIKSFVICSFLLYLGGAIYGCLRVKEGLEKRRLSRFDSYSVQYYDLEDRYFRVYPYSIQVVLTGDIEYSDPRTKSDILRLIGSFEKLAFIDGNYTQSVIRNWYSFLEENSEWLDFNITNEKSFISYLREVYISDPNDVLNLDVKYNSEFSKIVATRFVLQTFNLADSNADKDMMEGLREIADNSRFNVTIFNPFFIFFDQFVLVKTLTIQAISLAALVMMLVSLVFIPNPWCSMWVAFSIISIEVGVIGFMALWDVNLDSISMINLIMCIGFSVDFSAHISYAYLTAKVDTPAEKVKACLFTLGLPVVQGGLSTILGVVALLMAPSYIFLTFFKIVFLVIFFGLMHGIFLLPVLLSLFGPGSFTKKEELPYDPQKFVQKGDLLTKAPRQFISFDEAEAPKRRSRRSSPSITQEVVLHSGAFLAPPPPRSTKCPESNEKDMGLGTSEDSSEGSFQEVLQERRGKLSALGIEDTPVTSFPIKSVYSNKGFVSDTEDESRCHRDHRRIPKSHLGRGSSHYPSSCVSRAYVQRHHSGHVGNKKVHRESRRKSRQRDDLINYAFCDYH